MKAVCIPPEHHVPERPGRAAQTGLHITRHPPRPVPAGATTALGGPDSYLGLPTSDEMDVPGGRVTYFEGGKILWRDGVATDVPHVSSMTFSSAITFAGGVPVGGSAQLTLFEDGSYRFTGNLHDSGALSYDTKVVVRLRGVSGQFYELPAHTGLVNGT